MDVGQIEVRFAIDAESVGCGRGRGGYGSNLFLSFESGGIRAKKRSPHDLIHTISVSGCDLRHSEHGFYL